jgi:hypothetical protein
MRHALITAVVLAFSLTAAGAPALAAPCKDAQGRFIKCPPPAPVKPVVVRCKDASGRFAKCGTPGAKPV